MTTRKPAWAFTATKKQTDTFAGGAPYLAKDEAWPRHADGTAWCFLVQIALKDVPDIGLALPKEGYLQFFHHSDELYGMSFDNPSDPSEGTEVLVRHVTDVEDMGDHIPDELVSSDDHYSPLESPLKRVYYKGALVQMEPFEGSLDAEEAARDEDEDSGFMDRLLNDFSAWANEGGTVREDDVSEGPDLAPEDYEFHLGGFPAFTQQDFRDDLENEVLLLGSESGKNIIWGDMGVASFWLKTEDADALHLDKAFIHWDCY